MKNYDALYTPKTIDDIVFMSPAIRQQVSNLVTGRHPFPASGMNGILLWGTVGTGKTELANLLPDAIERARGGECAYHRFFAVSQGGDNGADVIEKIKDSSKFVPFGCQYHYWVLDEVDNLRKDSMLSLRSAMGQQNTIFVMTTNHLSKVEASVRNRSHLIQMNAASDLDWLLVVKKVLATEYKANVYTDAQLLAIIHPCAGSARQIMNATYALL